MQVPIDCQTVEVSSHRAHASPVVCEELHESGASLLLKALAVLLCPRCQLLDHCGLQGRGGLHGLLQPDHPVKPAGRAKLARSDGGCHLPQHASQRVVLYCVASVDTTFPVKDIPQAGPNGCRPAL